MGVAGLGKPFVHRMKNRKLLITGFTIQEDAWRVHG
jgi:hypothetical protein